MAQPRTDLPTGTVTFFRTDVEGSMRHARALGSRWDELNAQQLETIRAAVVAGGGTTVRTEGDALFAVFTDAVAAIRAAIDSQTALTTTSWPPDAVVRVRIGLHAGEAHLAGDDYGGFDVNRAARIAGVGHGGQIVISDPVRALVASDLPPGVRITDLGRHALRDVAEPEQLFQLEAPGLPAAFPPLRTAAAAAGNLPPRLTSFIGRDAAIEELEGLLGEARLVTILGPGGMGKTSLAIEIARRQANLPDGAWFVALDVVTEPADVMAEVARTLGLHDASDRSPGERVGQHLADRTALLVLDNFEHVLAAAADVPPLLRAAPGLRIMVTSRAPLRVAGEQVYPVPPLDDTAGGSAERLFMERARATAAGWSPGNQGALVTEICELLDGSPLGIELAAARVALLPLATIRDRLAARLPLPGAGPRDLPDRQRTLEATIAWSVDMLEPGLRQLLRRLAVFEGGFDLEQAEIVGADPATGPPHGDVLDGIAALTDQSLIVPDRAISAGVRFRMLETIRAFALRDLEAAGETVTMRGRHAAAFRDLAEAAATHWLRVEQATWLDRLTDDHANIRAAVEWSIEHGPVETAQRLAAALWRYWQFGGHLREARAFVDRVVELDPEEPTPARLWALGAAGSIAYWQADTAEAAARYREQLAVARQVGDRPGEADALFNLASSDFILGDSGSSRAYLAEARRLYEELGDHVGPARISWAEHNLLLYAGQPEAAAAILGGLMPTYEANGDVMYQALAAGSLAFVNLLADNMGVAAYWARRSIERYHTIRDTATATITLAACAIALVEADRPGPAATLLGAYEGLCERYGVQPPAGLGYVIGTFRPVERTIEALRADEYAAAYGRGTRMSLDEAVAFVVKELARLEVAPTEDPPGRG